MMFELETINKLVSEATPIEFKNFLQVIKSYVKKNPKNGDLNPTIISRALTRAKSLQEYNNGLETMKFTYQFN